MITTAYKFGPLLVKQNHSLSNQAIKSIIKNRSVTRLHKDSIHICGEILGMLEHLNVLFSYLVIGRR